MSPFKKALKSDWDKLPKVIKDHYDLEFGKNEVIVVEGIMNEIYHNWYASIFTFIGKFFNALVPYQGKDVKVKLINKINEKGEMLWERNFFFEGKDPYKFKSKMVYEKDHQVIEYIKFGLGLSAKLEATESYLKYSLNSYILNLFGLKISIPSIFVLGSGYIIEKVLDHETFEIDFKIKHPLFGNTFGYSGKFKISK